MSEMRTTRWWKDLALTESLSFARDRLVECYFWFMGVQFEPHYSRSRVIVTKVVAFISILDDIYDVYGTLEEGRVLNDAIQRWDPKAVDQLPEYLKDFFLKLLNVFDDDFKNVLSPKEQYRVSYLKEAMKALSRAFFEEAKWCAERYVPTLDEHLQVSMMSIAYPPLACAYFAGMGQAATQETFEWMNSFPMIFKACATICRILDDLASHELEQKRDHVASTVECYMKQYGTSMEAACEKLRGMVEDSWKDAKKECLNIPTTSPVSSFQLLINLARTCDYIYKHNDSYTNAETRLKDDISLLLVQPVPVY